MPATLRFKVVDEAFGKKAIEVPTPKERPSEFFAKYVFNKQKMFKYLSADVYEKMCDVIDRGTTLDLKTADAVAEGMKRWAMELGVTHTTHWFQPLTEGTAEKHDGMVEHDGKGGMLEDFCGKQLVQQEPDASSFPSGGIRSTFEARGYSAWDPASPVFVMGDTLMIPTVFISYTGEALDYKAPLKKSIKAVGKAALDVARMFYPEISSVKSHLGWEQEYFLVDESFYSARPDLAMTGRTLMGHDSAKNQQMDDHYFGSIPSRVVSFMKDLEIQALELGIPCKTRHNEVAPNQFELAPIFEETNLAIDHNMLIMALMKKVARKHGFRCLLHEKPFKGINGSGKHNNWSLSTNTGILLHAPGKTPVDNLRFITFIVETLMAVYRHNGLLKASIVSATNAHRLGAHEAPPAIVSIFLGDQLQDIFDQIEHGEATSSLQGGKMRVGVNTLPALKKDATDRNRTSPFAFTGNKFEFRMPPSSNSISGPNFALNTIVAEELRKFADELEQAEDFDTAVHELVRRTYVEHKRIIFDGNGYSDEWREEAVRRGLPNITNSIDAVTAFTDDKVVELFGRHGVLSRLELQSRAEIRYENYVKQINIEAKTMIDIASKQIRPAVVKYAGEIARSVAAVKSVGMDAHVEEELLKDIMDNLNLFQEKLKLLVEVTDQANLLKGDSKSQAIFCRDYVFQTMKELREPADRLEMLVDEENWPFPTYGELLYNI